MPKAQGLSALKGLAAPFRPNATDSIENRGAAISRYMFGDPTKPAGAAALRERAELAQEAFARFKSLWDAAFVAQVARRGVDPARLYHEIGGEVTSCHRSAT